MGTLLKLRGRAPHADGPCARNQACMVVLDEIVLASLNILAQMGSLNGMCRRLSDERPPASTGSCPLVSPYPADPGT